VADARSRPIRIVVVGGGIAGLAAAHRLVELAAAGRVPVEVVLCEARPRLGGIIATERAGAYLVEAGPDAFLAEKPWGLALCARLGLTSRLIGTRPALRRTFVMHAGRLHPLPDGFALMAPARFGPVARSRLFSWPGKARMAMDLVLPSRPARGDESLAQFVTRRLGREVLERVAQPMIAGIYTADPETLSLAATMPRFLELERRYRSVIRGLRHTRADRPGPGAITGQRWTLFVAPADGMEALVTALTARLPVSAVRTGTRVAALERADGAGGSAGRYRVLVDRGPALDADGIIVATEAHHAGRLLRGLDPELAALLHRIPYASSAAVTVAYRREQVAHPLDGFGFVVPAAERRPVLACTFSSVKFVGRAPDGHVLLRAFLGGALAPGILDRDDRALAETAERDLAAALGITGAPRLTRVHRHPDAMPQYLIGHLNRVAAIEAHAARHEALALAGGAYRGVGIPDCIRSGEVAAERALAACRLEMDGQGGAGGATRAR